ncbi:MAG: lipoate--protein ligase family protein [Oscillatoriaceae bacterium SKW80]|nr:lipoate--protein ligase family protein [Oscillatoriaceae bacterium SKYG93]MCX8120231.1 lipoate--protein ligase family protein [Oscillatoriaceae bacterium SKW80]MDW8453157.1 biotin/lipoate A/B protein ligase family protein [Oscillatoriaceae cyanobacterium SKYGB_i_bin93]
MGKMSNYWRLIPLLEAPAQIQMAIDRWLLEQHCAGLHSPVLRFYTWSPAAISLGYNQQRWPNFWQQLHWQGVPMDLVRRPTGGRAVLHQGDLTYTVVMSGLRGKRLEIYKTICEFLIKGWQRLGIELYYGSAKRNYIHNPNCFGTATAADLVTSNGIKLIGSAQLIRDGAILQHGSMPLQQDAELFYHVFGTPLQALALPLSATGNALFQMVAQTLTLAAADCFRVELVEQPFSESEWQEILKIASINCPCPSPQQYL